PPPTIPPPSLHDALPIFADIAVKTSGKRLLAIPLHGACRKRHHRRRGETRIASKFGNHAKTVEVGHVQIQNDEVGGKFAGKRHGDRKSTRLNSSHQIISY